MISNTPFLVTIRLQFKKLGYSFGFIDNGGNHQNRLLCSLPCYHNLQRSLLCAQRYDFYRALKRRSENKGIPFDYVNFNDFLERHDGIKVGSEKYKMLKEAGEFVDQQSKGVWLYYWVV